MKNSDHGIGVDLLCLRREARFRQAGPHQVAVERTDLNRVPQHQQVTIHLGSRFMSQIIRIDGICDNGR